MPRSDWQENTVERLFEARYPHGLVRSVLDIGCGLSMKSQFIDADVRVGVDVSRVYLEEARKQSPIGDSFVLIHADVMFIDQLFLDKSFDLVMCFDVIEHLPRDNGLRLLKMMEQIARVAVCVETPKGYVPQNLDITGFEQHRYQTHRSGWQPEDFIAQGYAVSVRDYEMCDVPRHSEIAVAPQIQLIDAIKRMDW